MRQQVSPAGEPGIARDARRGHVVGRDRARTCVPSGCQEATIVAARGTRASVGAALSRYVGRTPDRACVHARFLLRNWPMHRGAERDARPTRLPPARFACQIVPVTTASLAQAHRCPFRFDRSPGRCSRSPCSHRRGRAAPPRREEDGLHDHRQLGRREGSVPAQPRPRTIRVRRAGRARPPRLARVGVPQRRALRRARHLRPLRRRQRVLLRSHRGARIPAGRRDGARLVQRLVPRPVLAAEGGLPVRLQHAQPGGQRESVGGDRAQPRARRPLARRRRAHDARRSRRATARAAATACG